MRRDLTTSERARGVTRNLVNFLTKFFTTPARAGSDQPVGSIRQVVERAAHLAAIHKLPEEAWGVAVAWKRLFPEETRGGDAKAKPRNQGFDSFAKDNFKIKSAEKIPAIKKSDSRDEAGIISEQSKKKTIHSRKAPVCHPPVFAQS